MKKAKIGVIGGSGLYQLPGLENLKEQTFGTDFGEPSDVIMGGTFKGTHVYFLPRHGRGHKFLPSEVNYRANIAALKKVGCTHILSMSAVGSMREDYKPGDFVLVDQFIDWTKGKRASTFFGEGVVGHTAFSDPICKDTFEILAGASQNLDFKVHKGGTYICIEGPQFSTRAESLLYKSWGVSVIGMTNVPECKLAREAGMSYASISMVTDFDCWHADHEAVTIEEVMKTFHENVKRAHGFLSAVIPVLGEKATFPFAASRWNSVVTSKEKISTKEHDRLKLILSE